MTLDSAFPYSEGKADEECRGSNWQYACDRRGLAGRGRYQRDGPVDSCLRGIAQLEIDVACSDEETDERKNGESELHRLLEHNPHEEAYREHDQRWDDRS